MRDLLAIPCGVAELAASLDRAEGTTGLLIVAGGTELRSGAHGGLAALAARVAAAGHPVLRFDRRGVGDSPGDDGGFANAGEDIAAAAAALRARCPRVQKVAGFGLCDGAAALALHHRGAGLHRLLLANPWVVEPTAEGLPPPAAIRRRYAQRLRDPAAWRRLLGGRIDLAKAMRGVRAAARSPHGGALADRVRAGLGGVAATALLAKRDATAIAFADEHARRPFPALRVETLDSSAHSFATPGDAEWLTVQMIEALRDM